MDFKDTDRLIGNLDRCVHFLTISGLGPGGTFHEGIFNQGVILQYRWPDLFNTLVEITNSTASEDDKQTQRYEAFAVTFKKPGNIEYGKKVLAYTFDEQIYIDYIKRNNDFYSISVEVEKIESEFWRNCSGPKNINFLCNIYRERWIGHLYEVDLEYYNWQNFLYKDNTHPLYINFKALRDCGLIRAKESELECGLVNVGQRVNFIVSGIFDFFTKMRRSAIDTKDLPDPADQKNTSPEWKISQPIGSINGTNMFNGQPLADVKNHFIMLCQITSKGNKKPILTPQQVDDFIQQAFIINAPADQKITMNKGSHDGANIKRVFWNYWDSVKDGSEYSTPNNNIRADYVRLLTDHFLGWDFKKVMDNFTK